MHDGIARCCTLEEVLNFKSTAKAIAWINQEKKDGLPFVFRNDGLAILWSQHIESDTLWIMVHQLMINGRKPTYLPGAEDSRLVETKSR
jgi:hypothetical protein